MLIVSLQEAATTLSALLNVIDLFEDPAEVAQCIDESMQTISSAIDRRKFVLREIEAKEEVLARMRSDMQEYAHKLDRVREGIKKSTLKILQDNPEVEFRDSLGKKVYIAQNSQPELILDPDYQVKDEADKYLVENISFDLDKPKLLHDLQAGMEVGFARIRYGYHVRGL